LASIKSELLRRQSIFGDAGVNNINQYTKHFKEGELTLPLPHLFIISDEFAELKKEQPEFMSELVSTARIGRSLGVHLILATQKPSGVVDDQIWSNSKFKLALKVADESDSNEMLKTPDAARITQPGRAYLQVGNNEIYELFQSAWSGAPFSEDVVKKGFDSRVYLLNSLGQGELLNDDLSEVDSSSDSKLTQLDVVVNYIHDLHNEMNSTIVDRPWLPSLSHQIVTEHIKLGVDIGTIENHDLTVQVGMIDIPEEQLQKEYIHSFNSDGNLAVFGASGFGKSTLIMNTALTLASKNSPQLLNYFILDYGNSALSQLKGLPHTADYLTFDDTEKLDKLVKLILEELKHRKSLFAGVNAMNFRMYNEIADNKIPAIVFVIDNYDVIKEINHGELEEFIVKLTRDGVGVGIYTLISASRSNIVKYSVLNNFKNKIAQFMFDESEISAVVGRSSYKLPEVKGRALIKLKDVHIAQCYLPVPFEDDISYTKEIGNIIETIADNNTVQKATGVRIVPDTVVYEDLIPYIETSKKLAIIGFDTETTDPTYLDLSITPQLIVGGAVTGKTNILKLIAKQFSENNEATIFISDSPAGDLYEFENIEKIVYMDTPETLETFYKILNAIVEEREKLQKETDLRPREFLKSLPPVVVLIDEVENFVELTKPKGADMERLFTRATQLGIGFIATTTPQKLKGYDNITNLIKVAGSGLALGNPGDQHMLTMQVARTYVPTKEIGFVSKRGEVSKVKMPLV
jgi:S-DNA-T family DNA segregation ATPase FtsK/SpoIIIE